MSYSAIRPWWLVTARRHLSASYAMASIGSLASKARLLASSTIGFWRMRQLDLHNKFELTPILGRRYITSRPRAVPNIMGLRLVSLCPPNQAKQVIWPHRFPWSSRTWRQLFVESSQIRTVSSSPATNLMSRIYHQECYIPPLARSSPLGLKDKQFTAPFIPLNLMYFLYFWDWDEKTRDGKLVCTLTSSWFTIVAESNWAHWIKIFTNIFAVSWSGSVVGCFL